MRINRRTTAITRVAVATVAVLLLAGACSSSKNKTTTAKATNTTASSPATASANVKDVHAPALPLALNDGVPQGTKIGLLVSGSGPGNDVFGPATGAYVAGYRLNGASGSQSGTVQLIVKDDSADPTAAVAAMQDFANQGVAGVVYASAGDQMGPAVQAAAQAGLPVLVPYSGDTRLTQQGATTFLTGPNDDQVAAKLVKQAASRNLQKVAVLHEAGSYGDAGMAALQKAGLVPVKDAAFQPTEADLNAEVKQFTDAGADGMIVWADATEAVKATTAAGAAATPLTLLFGNRAATPAFGRLETTLIAPTAQDGLLSAGTWAGPWTPTDTIDAFYEAKAKSVSDGGVIADLTNADVRSHDAVVALAFAAKAAKSNKASDVLNALKTLKPEVAGTPLDFSQQNAVSDGNVAMLTYSTVDDGSGRYPDVTTSGGHWVAVDGSYTIPDSLKGLDNAYGG
jgi:ABC-type branched-subunit amino acid transport system substrate-binding protein